MPGVFHSLTSRIRRFYNRPTLTGRLIRALVLFAGTLVAGVIVLIAMVWLGLFGKLPDRDELRAIRNPVASEVYSADSVLLGRYFLEERSPISASDLPKGLKNALIATEDVRFYDHHGVDLRSLLRVLVKTILLQDQGAGGGSTLTQQLAKNLYPRRSYAFLSMPINKIREFLIAWRIENVYAKDEIILLYLNTIPFSDNTYGIKTAADRFFSRSVNDLTTEQAAVLVGMLKATHSYNPRLFPERSRKRRNVVLAQMEKYEFISPQEGEELRAQPLKLEYNNTGYSEGLAPYFRAYLERELQAWCRENRKEDGNPYNLKTDGLKVYTTIDARMQEYAEHAMRMQMHELQSIFQAQLNEKTVIEIASKKVRELPQYKFLKAEGLSDADIMKRLKEPMKTRIFTWDGDSTAEISVLDSLKHHMQFLQAGVLAMEPETGAIRVWIGGIDYGYFQYDHVRESTKRQVGSTLKPLVYAAALEQGIGPCDYISARKTSYTNMEDWTPENTDDETYEKKYSMEGALAGSVNTVSVKLLEKTGIHNAIQTMRSMGLSSDLPAVPSLALGTPSISMMEMVGAYSALAARGNYTAPYYLISIMDRNGRVLETFRNEEEPTQAIAKETSQMIVHMLKTVVSEGTGSALRSRFGLSNDIAGKTGTTQSNVDGWFIAMMPKLVIGAWVGSDDPRLHFRSTAQGQGAATALPIVGRFLQQANKDKSLSSIMWAKFPPMPEELLESMDCRQSRSNTNIFQRIFKKKKGTKVTRFGKKKEKG